MNNISSHKEDLIKLVQYADLKIFFFLLTLKYWIRQVRFVGFKESRKKSFFFLKVARPLRPYSSLELSAQRNFYLLKIKSKKIFFLVSGPTIDKNKNKKEEFALQKSLFLSKTVEFSSCWGRLYPTISVFCIIKK